MRNRLFSHILPAIIGGFVGIVLFFGFAYSAPKRTLVEASDGSIPTDKGGRSTQL